MQFSDSMHVKGAEGRMAQRFVVGGTNFWSGLDVYGWCSEANRCWGQRIFEKFSPFFIVIVIVIVINYFYFCMIILIKRNTRLVLIFRHEFSVLSRCFGDWVWRSCFWILLKLLSKKLILSDLQRQSIDHWGRIRVFLHLPCFLFTLNFL